MISLVSLISVPMAAVLCSSAVTQNPPAADQDKDVVVRVIEAPKTTKLLKSDAIVYTRAGDNDGSNQAKATMVVNQGDGTLKVVRINDDIEVTLNGKKLSDDRFQLKGGKIIIFDKEGGKLHEMSIDLGDLVDLDDIMSITPGGAIWRGDKGRLFLQEGPGGLTIGGVAPQGRIGVMMGALDETLRDHLGIDNEDAFIITGVVDGAPAAKAGIRAHDIVVRVNSQSASQDLLRKVVVNSDPGATIRLRIIRKGQPKDVTVTVEKVQGGVTIGPGGGIGRFMIERHGDQDVDFDFDFDVDFDTDWDFDVHFDTDQFRNMLRGQFDEKQLKDVIIRLRAAQPNVKEFTTRLRTLRPQLKGLPNVLDLQRRINVEDIHKQMQEALQNIEFQVDDGARAQIEAAMKDAMGKIFVHFQEEDATPRIFELMPAPKADRKIMILPEGRLTAPLRLLADTALRAPRRIHFTDDAGDDRLERLEDRLDRLEKLLDRLADQLDDLMDDLP